MFGINNLRAQLTGEGARPTLFRVELNNPVFPAANFKIPFMVKAASLPSSTVGKIEGDNEGDVEGVNEGNIDGFIVGVNEGDVDG